MSDKNPAGGPGEGLRLDKRLMELLGCSRGDAQLLVEGGWVRVDGQVVEAPQFKVGSQAIEVDPEARLAPSLPATILLHKPAGMSEAEALAVLRPEARSALDDSGIRPVQRHFKNLLPLYPLERSASGLMVLSQDARVQRRAEEDGYLLEQEFVVEVAGELAANGLERLARGLTVEGRRLPPAKVSWQNEIRLRFALKGALPGQIHALCAAVDLEVLGLRRLRLGRVGLAKMAVGEWRFLAPEQRF
ncbi:MAG: RNA-binding protein [Gammaproteobacteria bacterium]|nr:RNA-binding protein [Gammaproteobacteria bacterium]